MEQFLRDHRFAIVDSIYGDLRSFLDNNIPNFVNPPEKYYKFDRFVVLSIEDPYLEQVIVIRDIMSETMVCIIEGMNEDRCHYVTNSETIVAKLPEEFKYLGYDLELREKIIGKSVSEIFDLPIDVKSAR